MKKIIEKIIEELNKILKSQRKNLTVKKWNKKVINQVVLKMKTNKMTMNIMKT
jgi:hypothetical protein